MADSVLTRLSYRDPPENRDPSPVQEKTDEFVYSFKDQLSDPILIASQLAGAGVYSLFRLGTLRLFGPVLKEGLAELREAQVARQAIRGLLEAKAIDLPAELMKSSSLLERQKLLEELWALEGKALSVDRWIFRTETKNGLRNGSSYLLSMLAGSETFDLTRRSLLSLSGKETQYPNLWTWNLKKDGMAIGMAQSLSSFGLPLFSGDVFGNEFLFSKRKEAWAIAGAFGLGSYLLTSLWANPYSIYRCGDWNESKEMCQ